MDNEALGDRILRVLYGSVVTKMKDKKTPIIDDIETELIKAAVPTSNARYTKLKKCLQPRNLNSISLEIHVSKILTIISRIVEKAFDQLNGVNYFEC